MNKKVCVCGASVPKPWDGVRLNQWLEILRIDPSSKNEEIDDVYSASSEGLYFELYCESISDKVVRMTISPKKDSGGFTALERSFIERFGNDYAGLSELLEEVYRTTLRTYRSRLSAPVQDVVPAIQFGAMTITGRIEEMPGLPIVCEPVVSILL